MSDKLKIYFLNYSLEKLKSDIKWLNKFTINYENELTKDNEELKYIFLRKPIFNPLCIEIIRKLLEKICPKHYALYENCNCKNKYKKLKLVIDNDINEYVFSTDDKNVYTANDAYEIFSNIGNDILKKFGFLKFENIKIQCKPCDLILYHIPIIPKYIRPSSKINNLDTEDIITNQYKKILNENEKNNSTNLYETYKNIIIKNNKYDIDKHKSIIQRIGSKKGVFRSNILGKRTKLCGRSVISPDIYIKINEIGIPKKMANALIINNRLIRDGDYVLFIRHPTLQKMSVMSMKVKIQKTSYTIKMNPALCYAYNADFDGDEMNIFCLSNYKSIAEAIYINSPLNCIISPENNKPIIYPSQDCISGLYILTYKNTKIKKTLFYNCLNIIKKIKNPIEYKNNSFNGRSLFSLTLPNDFNFYDNKTKIKNGVLLNGYINKDIILKIIVLMLNKYNKCFVFEFIYNIQIIIEMYLTNEKLSIGYDDCFIPLVSEKVKKNIDINSLIIINNNNSFNYIIKSGSKGSYTNMLQIINQVGQQYIKNKKIDKLFFLENDSFCYNSYSNGLNYYEYFYQSQSGREGVISTNIKTPKIGYIQRQISKFLENLIIQYNGYIISNNYILK
jgi:DNA-directed RNA polymerase beta' subunit